MEDYLNYLEQKIIEEKQIKSIDIKLLFENIAEYHWFIDKKILFLETLGGTYERL